jgi:uncharacterized protein (DUF2235 family)
MEPIMGRNLIVLADGTGNSAGKLFKTNVWRLYQALDLSDAGQIAVFADGVGTSGFKPFEIVGLALGFGVKRRVLALYKFLCLNYREGDRIYALGFSRGAFTVRVLIGLITREGLVNFKSQEELDRNALAAYRAFRPKAFPVPKWQFWVWLSRLIRDSAIAAWNELTGSRNYEYVKPKPTEPRSGQRIRIHFLGVWDTVAAYGLPVDELTKAVDKWVWPMTFEKKNLLDSVDRARQALSIDDERRTFFPIRWDEDPKDTTTVDGEAPRLRQVWFAGSHSNVGGGYPDDRLAHIPLCWMIGEAAECGLRFKPDVVADYWDYASTSGRIYDSRAGLGIFYRYHPRAAGWLMGESAVPLVDGSVLLRMAEGSDSYAPLSLPRKMEVLSPSGDRLPFPGSSAKATATKAASKDKLPLPADRKRDLARMEQNFRSVLAKLEQAGAFGHGERVQLMRDTIWWRRGLYYVMLGLALLAATYPLFAGYFTHKAIDQADVVSRGLIGPIVGLLKGLLPGFAAPWLDAIRQYPTQAILLAGAFGACLGLNAVLRKRIHDRAAAAWGNVVAASAPSQRKEALQRLTLSGALAFGIAAAAVGLARNPGALGLLAGCLGCAAVFLFQRLRPARHDDRSALLGFARTVRMSPFANWLYNALKEYILPAAFLTLSLGLIAMAANKLTFEAANSAGAYCAAPLKDHTTTQPLANRPIPFSTSSICQDTENWVQAGMRYRVTIAIDEPWFDDGLEAGTLGVKGGWVHYLGTLTKRWWGEPWFKPIVRVGRYGNDEYVLAPVQPRPGQEASANTTLVAEITPRFSGELYIFVNDAIVALPGLSGYFYRYNQGSAKVLVEEIDA